ncbi:hypothetical protein DFJ58DRAFT_751836 [Suillus subalutaceus]|uniref:uncharacterized protein n=1 Tax=Suillus subalutaceus TaxID=48586 RepID=UPI001B874DD3|nr:uncharacterized protein DFJ58DRAFT_751836 [Suillus subalutaceus]KAG1811316.1 hypothetical protein DFJ58DRAFT_751836 [Suillus subalutaceus]
MDSDATLRPVQKVSHRFLPGFFDDARHGVRSSVSRHCDALAPPLQLRSSATYIRSSATPNPSAKQLNTSNANFSRGGPHTVEVAAVRDKRALFVARRPAHDHDKAKRIQQ